MVFDFSAVIGPPRSRRRRPGQGAVGHGHEADVRRGLLPGNELVHKAAELEQLIDEIEAFKKQQAAFGTDNFAHLHQQYLRTVESAKAVYVESLRAKISSLPRNDRRWWALTRQLLNNKVKMCSIPNLKNETGAWLTDGFDKAELFRRMWEDKFE